MTVYSIFVQNLPHCAFYVSGVSVRVGVLVGKGWLVVVTRRHCVSSAPVECSSNCEGRPTSVKITQKTAHHIICTLHIMHRQYGAYTINI